MKIDTTIIEQYDNFILEGKYSFFVNIPVFNRLQEVGLIDEEIIVDDKSLKLALVEILDQPNVRYPSGELKPNGWIIVKQGINHREVKSQAILVSKKIAIRRCFEWLRDEKKDIQDYLK